MQTACAWRAFHFSSCLGRSLDSICCGRPARWRWTGVKEGANLIGLDLASVKRNLELVSVIDSVSVERVLPHTLRVRVTERQPIAQVNVPQADSAGGISV